MGPPLLGNGNLLPLESPDAELWMFNAIRIHDALVGKKSEIIRLSAGRVLAIERYFIRPVVVGDVD